MRAVRVFLMQRTWTPSEAWEARDTSWHVVHPNIILRMLAALVGLSHVGLRHVVFPSLIPFLHTTTHCRLVNCRPVQCTDPAKSRPGQTPAKSQLTNHYDAICWRGAV